MIKNTTKAVTSLCLIFILIWSVFMPAIAADRNPEKVYISTKEDFEKFAKNCTLDSWSRGKTFNLTNDIDMDGKEFPSVPSFGGTFDGGGHTISGVSIKRSGSTLGVFRYIQPSGTVTNLHIKGIVTPEGTKSAIGGIAGQNSGTINACSFNGTVSGNKNTGGIAGINEESGRIASSKVIGTVSSESFTGGITGKNSGTVMSCTNASSVNTTYRENEQKTNSVSTDAASIIEDYKIAKDTDEEIISAGHTDTGGIAGYNNGIIQGCENHGTIGYSHVGYNVGGIAGRQAGYIVGCKNYGHILGRKDIGGIVGQAEPYMILSADGASLETIKSELNKLRYIVDGLIDDADDLGDSAKIHADRISEYSADAIDNTQTIIDKTADFANDNIAEINAQAAIISNTIDKLAPVIDDLEDCTDRMSDSVKTITDAISAISIEKPELDEDTKKLRDALDNLNKGEGDLRKALGRTRNVLVYLDEAIEINNSRDIKRAVQRLTRALDDIAAARTDIYDSLKEISDILKTPPSAVSQIPENAEKIRTCVETIANSVSASISAVNDIRDALAILSENIEIDLGAIADAMAQAEKAIGYISSAMNSTEDDINDIFDSIDSIYKKLDAFTDDASGQIEEARKKTRKAADELSIAFDDMTSALDKTGRILTDLSDEKKAEFVKLDDEFRGASDGLFDTLSGVSGEINSLKSVLSDKSDNISSRLTDINNQFNLIMTLVSDSIDTSGTNDIFLDVSDEDISGTRRGKISDCTNSGKTEGDRNIGGIAGAMAVEYSKDPEDDIEKPDALNFTYLTKAVLQACINDASITGKKNCVGGIAGYAEIGTVFRCENYGGIESTSGDFAGGIAGKSDSVLRKSCSKSSVSGKRYIGGIAGMGKSVYFCRSISYVTGDEFSGAVMGYTENNHGAADNLFVDFGTGAIDGISYDGKAEPVTYERMKNLPDVPDRFVSFRVRFIASEKVIASREAVYGEKTSDIIPPEIPEKKGYFGKWQKPETDTVNSDIDIVCEYSPYVTVISSDEKSASGRPVALAEGSFTDDTRLTVTEQSGEPPAQTNGHGSIYRISIRGMDIADDDEIKIRMLNEGKKSVTVWCKTDDGWQKTANTPRGKYVMFQTAGADSTVCITYGSSPSQLLYLLLLLPVAAVIFVLRRKKKI